MKIANSMLTFWQLGPFRKSLVFKSTGPYLLRYEFVSKLLTLKYHVFLSGDEDRALHDHPWSWYCTIPLSLKGYIEEVTSTDKKNRRFMHVVGFRLNTRRGSHRHAVLMDQNLDVMRTLFIAGPRTRNWGFYPEFGKRAGYFVPWREWENYCTESETPSEGNQ